MKLSLMQSNKRTVLVFVVVNSNTYMASKSAHRLLATYNSSTDFRFFPLHSAIIFSCSSIDFSSAAIRASLGEKKKNIFFSKVIGKKPYSIVYSQ